MQGAPKVLLNSSIFAVSVIAGSLALPRPMPGLSDAVFQLLLRELDEVELVFAGSSNIRMIDVGRFEAEAADRGVPVRAFNLGVYGMWPQETELFLNAALRPRPPRLRYIVLDLRPWKARYLDPVEPENPRQKRRMEYFRRGMDLLMGSTDRELWWHTPRATLRMLHIGLVTKMPPEVQRGHLRLGLERVLPLGLALGFLERRAQRLTMDQARARLDDADRAVNNFQMPRDDYEVLLRRMEEVDTKWNRELTAAYLRRQLNRLRARGYQVFCLYPPLVEPGSLTNARELEALLPGEEIWNFADPARYPELFDFENRLEQIHLNRAGNAIYARLMAEKFADWMGRNGGAS